MTENNKQPGSTSLTIKLPSLEVLTFLVLELYFLGTLIFSVFGLIRGRTNFLFGSLEDVSRFWLSLALGILIYFFARNKQVLLGASIVVAILHFVMPLTLQLFASDVETWRFLASLGSGTWVPTGFQTAMFLMDLAFILLLAAVIAAYPTNSYQVARWILMAPVRLARYLGAGWQASKLGEKLLGIGLSVYLINVLLFFGIGLLEGYPVPRWQDLGRQGTSDLCSSNFHCPCDRGLESRASNWCSNHCPCVGTCSSSPVGNPCPEFQYDQRLAGVAERAL